MLSLISVMSHPFLWCMLMLFMYFLYYVKCYIHLFMYT